MCSKSQLIANVQKESLFRNHKPCTHVCINNLTRTKISLAKNLGLVHKFSSSFIVAAYGRCLGTSIYKNENIETSYLRIVHTLAVEDKNISFTFFFIHHRYGYKKVVLGRGYLSQHVVESS